MARFAACLCAAACWLLPATRAVHAHHSFAAEFDARHPRTLVGVIAVVDWVNPHSVLWIDVPGARGPAERWGLELAPPNGLLRRGIRRAMLRPGDRIVARAYPARDGRRFASVRSLTLADGFELVLGPRVSP